MKVNICIILLIAVFLYGCKKPEPVKDSNRKGFKASSYLKDKNDKYHRILDAAVKVYYQPHA